MSTATPATQALKKAGVPFQLREYEYVPGLHQIAVHAAEAVDMDPGVVFKTLMVEVDGKPACCVVPSDHSLSMKKVAHHFGGKSATMMDAAKAEKLTGFHTGGISPFGQKRRAPVAFEESALSPAEIVINGGKRGLMVLIAPADALKAANAKAADICAQQA